MSRKSRRQFRRGKHKPPASGREPSLRLTQRDVEASADELVAFHRLFQPLFQRREQRQWSAWYLCGQLANAVGVHTIIDPEGPSGRTNPQVLPGVANGKRSNALRF